MTKPIIGVMPLWDDEKSRMIFKKFVDASTL